jgi:hypothetical protein
MSKEVKEEDKQEKKNEVVITGDDCNAALDFWRHFNIPILPELEKAMAAFSANPTFENQEDVKMWICTAISTSDHVAFKDEMFTKIVEECAGVTYDMRFKKDLEETLTEEK